MSEQSLLFPMAAPSRSRSAKQPAGNQRQWPHELLKTGVGDCSSLRLGSVSSRQVEISSCGMHKASIKKNSAQKSSSNKNSFCKASSHGSGTQAGSVAGSGVRERKVRQRKAPESKAPESQRRDSGDSRWVAQTLPLFTDGAWEQSVSRRQSMTETDLHMEAAFQLASALKAAKHRRRAMRGHAEAEVVRLTARQRKRAGTSICEHLLASLAQQVCAEQNQTRF